MAYNQTFHRDGSNSTDGYNTVTDTGTTDYYAGSVSFVGPVSLTSAVTMSGANTISGTMAFSGNVTMSSGMLNYKSPIKLTTALAASVKLKAGGLVVVRATAATKMYTVSSTDFPVGSRMAIYCTVGATSRHCDVKIGAGSSGAAPLTIDGANYVLSFREANHCVEVVRATSIRFQRLGADATTGATRFVWGATS